MYELYYPAKPYLLMGVGTAAAVFGSNIVIVVGGVVLALLGFGIKRMRNS